MTRRSLFAALVLGPLGLVWGKKPIPMPEVNLDTIHLSFEVGSETASPIQVPFTYNHEFWSDSRMRSELDFTYRLIVKGEQHG